MLYLLITTSILSYSRRQKYKRYLYDIIYVLDTCGVLLYAAALSQVKAVNRVRYESEYFRRME